MQHDTSSRSSSLLNSDIFHLLPGHVCDRDVLKALSLTHTIFLNPAQRWLFSTVKRGCNHQDKPFSHIRQFFDSHRHLSSHVHKLILTGGRPGDTTFVTLKMDNISHLLDSLSSLESLTLYQFQWRATPTILPFPYEYGQLRDLCLKHLVSFGGPSALELLQLAQCWRSVQLYDVDGDSGVTTLHSTPIPAQLLIVSSPYLGTLWEEHAILVSLTTLIIQRAGIQHARQLQLQIAASATTLTHVAITFVQTWSCTHSFTST